MITLYQFYIYIFIFQLSSIPELNSIGEKKEPQQLPIDDPKVVIENEPIIKEEVDEPLPKVNPEYERFVKMVQVGVPIEAVKLKVSLEGLDPTVLEKILK